MAVQTQTTQTDRRERLVGIGLMLISGLSFAWLPLFNRYASAAGANVLTTLTLRFMIAALIIWGILLARGRARLLRQKLWALALMGGIYVAQSTCFFISSRRIPVAMTSILLYLYPALVTLMAWLFLRERLTPSKLGALALALAGSVLIIGAQTASDALGVALGALSALLYSGYIVLGARLQVGESAQLSSAHIMLVAGLLFTLIAQASGELQLVLPSDGYLAIAGMALISTVLPIMTFFAGMDRIGAAQASIISAVEPSGTALLGVWLLGEQLSGTQLAGGACVLAAVCLLALRQERS